MMKNFDIDYDINLTEFEIILNICGFTKSEFQRYVRKSGRWYWLVFQLHPITYRHVDNLIAMIGGPDKYMKALRRARKKIEEKNKPRPLAPMPDPPKRVKKTVPEQNNDSVAIVTQEKEKITLPSGEPAEKIEPVIKPVRKRKLKKVKKAIPAEKPAADKQEKANLSDKSGQLEPNNPLFADIGITKDELF